ncbi:Protein ASPARTIC PROTEASE IN GUARD CELL 1 [Acorus calamus]|uniref:Protein ASPARTIC PROTEASE IN GUARD CELL 1 n=1 Tax=Acorus calamus TaxID=4465 RepID=A0AAV9D4D7_ACOCL|nr:Protein ASPARTIC PROTEASE IN GUARD CELL 1 [Acorus calamus]
MKLIMAGTQPFLLLHLLLLLCCSHMSSCRGDPSSHHHVFDIQSLLPAITCTGGGPHHDQGLHSEGSSSMRISHRLSPCSPLGGRLDDQSPTPTDLLHGDRFRVEFLQTRHKLSSSSNNNPTSSPHDMVNSIKLATLPATGGRAFGVGGYVVTVGYGTPKKNQTVIFDTGSDVSWIQCKPCVNTCFRQREPLFDPSESSSYRNISCGAPECAALTSRICSSNTCLYRVRYGDNSTTKGFLARETLTLTPSDVVENFVFGCGQNNSGLFGTTAGILGLGRGNLSLVSQTNGTFGGNFSYCLPSSSSNKTGHLTLGAVTRATNNNISYTPLNPNLETFYYLDLVGISVGGRILPINATVFSNAGTIIDSGTVITRLPSSAYAALRSAFRSGMSAYNSTTPSSSLLDTCYDFTGINNKVMVPNIVFHFNGGADMEVDVSGILYVESASRICLAFAGNKDDTSLGIIGSVQQRNLEVVYDTRAGRVGFGPGSCA